MNLKQIKRDINNLKDNMGKGKPSFRNFYKWCEVNYYHRPVDIREIWFNEYTTSDKYGRVMRVKSNPCLFLWLSDKYYRKIHKSNNPFKDKPIPLGSWKSRLETSWFYKFKQDEFWKPYNIFDRMNDPDYTKWFNQHWDLFIEKKDLSVFDELFDFDLFED